jgi:hypothetical protein
LRNYALSSKRIAKNSRTGFSFWLLVCYETNMVKGEITWNAASAPGRERRRGLIIVVHASPTEGQASQE